MGFELIEQAAMKDTIIVVLDGHIVYLCVNLLKKIHTTKRLEGLSPYKRIKYRMHHMSCDRKYMLADSLQPTDTQYNSNM